MQGTVFQNWLLSILWRAACARACFYVKRRDKTEWSRRLDTRGKQ